MRILIATAYPDYGGSTKVLKAAHRALQGPHEVLLRAPFGDGRDRLSASLPIETLSSVSDKLRLSPLLLRMLAGELLYVRRVRPDVIYLHDSPSLVIWGLVARIAGCRVVYHVHGDEGAGRGRRLKDRLIDAKVQIAEFLRDDWPGRQFLIANPIEVPALPARDRRAKQRLFVVGSISDRKNQRLAVEMLELLHQRGHRCSLHLCGPVLEPAYAANLEADIRKRGLAAHVIREGVLAPEDIYSKADVIVSTSRFEVQPLVFLEALAAGVPLVASRIAAHEELVQRLSLDRRQILCELDAERFADAVEATDTNYFTGEKARIARSFSPAAFQQALRQAFATLQREWLGTAPL